MKIDRLKVRFLVFVFLPLMTTDLGAMTLHLQMTPALSGTNSVLMKPAGANRTRFTIRCSTTESVSGAARFPVVRGGQLEVFGDEGLIMRCPLKPSEGADGALVYRFELQNDIARQAVFTLSVFRDDGQVGGGRVYSYRLLDFIDPQHEQKEMIQRIEAARKKMLRELQQIPVDQLRP